MKPCRKTVTGNARRRGRARPTRGRAGQQRPAPPARWGSPISQQRQEGDASTRGSHLELRNVGRRTNVGAILSVILVAGGLPAIRASRVDPMTALRDE